MIQLNELKNLDFKHINSESPGPIFVTFSAWSPSGCENFFGLNYFIKNNIHAILIRHKHKSLWWHSPEIYEIFSLIKKFAQQRKSKLILYGSSMGGYAAVHCRDLLEADVALAIAPQIFIDKNKYGFESRWKSDIDAIQKNFVFDEFSMFDNMRLLYIFWDPFHDLDNKHISLYKSSINNDLVNFIEVPYSNHDTARLLYASKMLEQILSQVYLQLFINDDLLKGCSIAFRKDPKCYFNYFRKIDISKIDKFEMDQFSMHASNDSNLDFEAMYLLAECYKLIGDLDQARKFIGRSISEYSLKFNKPAPEYLLLKSQNLLS